MGILGRGWGKGSCTRSGPDLASSDDLREAGAMEGLRLKSAMSGNKDSGDFRQGQKVGGKEISALCCSAVNLNLIKMCM